MNPQDYSGYVPDEDSRDSREDVASGSGAILDIAAMLKLAEIRGFLEATAIIAEHHAKALEALRKETT